MIRILLADDEPVALERLELAVAGIPEAELVASARNGRQALDLIRQIRPDVAVLDIQMPGKDGFAIVEELSQGDYLPEIVFVTAFDEHAVRAFEVKAIDYLLKPVSFARFGMAMERARERLRARTSGRRLAELQTLVSALQDSRYEDPSDRMRDVWVKTHHGLVKVAFDDVELITADGDYVSLHVGERAYLLKETMKSLASRLDPAAFARVHRSAIVNLAKVKSVRRRGVRTLSLAMDSGHIVAVGPKFVAATRNALQTGRPR